MKRYTATLVTLLTICIALPLNAASPLSALGYGLSVKVPNSRSAGMGVTSLAVPDTLALNLHAPALWIGARTTRYGFIGSYRSTKSKDATSTDVSDNGGFEGVAFAIPVSQGWFLGMALSPYTRMSYEWSATQNIGLGNALITQDGVGGLTQGLVAVSAPVRDDLRLGLAVKGIFGKVDRKWLQEYTDVTANSSSIEESERYKGFSSSLSAFWQGRFGWTAGISVDLPSSIDTEGQKKIKGANTTLVDTVTTAGSSNKTPLGFDFAVGKSLGRHFGTLEVGWQGWDALDKPVDLAGSFANAIRLGVGYEYKPNFNLFDSKWKALTYRGGLYTQQHYLKGASGNQLSSTALTAGISVPYFGGKSRMDIGIQYGWRGNVDDDGVAERFMGLVIGFNHSEEWFVGRKERRN